MFITVSTLLDSFLTTIFVSRVTHTASLLTVFNHFLAALQSRWPGRLYARLRCVCTIPPLCFWGLWWWATSTGTSIKNLAVRPCSQISSSVHIFCFLGWHTLQRERENMIKKQSFYYTFMTRLLLLSFLAQGERVAIISVWFWLLVTLWISKVFDLLVQQEMFCDVRF